MSEVPICPKCGYPRICHREVMMFHWVCPQSREEAERNRRGWEAWQRLGRKCLAAMRRTLHIAHGEEREEAKPWEPKGWPYD